MKNNYYEFIMSILETMVDEADEYMPIDMLRLDEKHVNDYIIEQIKAEGHLYFQGMTEEQFELLEQVFDFDEQFSFVSINSPVYTLFAITCELLDILWITNDFDEYNTIEQLNESIGWFTVNDLICPEYWETIREYFVEDKTQRGRAV